MDKRISNAIPAVIKAVIGQDVVRATKYLSDKMVVRACRPKYKTYKGKTGAKSLASYVLPRSNDNLHIVLTIGKPNYEQREFIGKCKKAGEPFPVKKVQLKFISKKK